MKQNGTVPFILCFLFLALILIPTTSSADTCVGHCGGNAGTCWCDNECPNYGDCCADYATSCLPSGYTLDGSFVFSNITWEKVDWMWEASRGLHPENVEEGTPVQFRVNQGFGLGSQVQSATADYNYGEYKATIKVPPATQMPYGTCSGFFYYWGINDDITQEIDVEILSAKYGYVYFTVHNVNKPTLDSHITFRVPVANPSGQYHTYGFAWTQNQIEFILDDTVPIGDRVNPGGSKYADQVLQYNVPARIIGSPATPIPSNPGNLMLNHWSGSAANTWAGQPPQGSGHIIMYVSNVSYVPSKTLSSVTVSGPSQVQENSYGDYTATAKFSDASTQNVTSSASWSENSSYSYMDTSVKGRLRANEVPSDQSVTVTASYTYNGVTKSGSLPLTIKNMSIIFLQNDVPVTNISGSQGSEKYYKITVPSGKSSLEIKIWGGSGDCDLYVKRGQQASTSNWDYRPYLGGNNETVTVSNPQAGDWYIMLRGWSAYSGVTLKVKY